MNRLNGWQRAWVVLGGVWAVFVGFLAVATLPDSPARLKEQQDNEWADHIYDHHYSTLSIDELRAEMRKPPKTDFNPDRVLPVEEAEAIDAKYNKLITGYPRALAEYLSGWSGVWAFPLIMVYLFGAGIAWVRAGFRRNDRD